MHQFQQPAERYSGWLVRRVLVLQGFEFSLLWASVFALNFRYFFFSHLLLLVVVTMQFHYTLRIHRLQPSGYPTEINVSALRIPFPWMAYIPIVPFYLNPTADPTSAN
jgi:hypothetical protein